MSRTTAPNEERIPERVARHTVRSWARFEDQVLLHLSALALIACIALMLLEVFLRSFMAYSIGWADELSRESMLIAYFLALGLTHRHGHFIRSGMMVDRLRPSLRRAFDLFGAACGMALSIALLVTGVTRVLRLRMLGAMTESSLETPLWIIGLLLPFGTLALLIYFAGAFRRALAHEHPFAQELVENSESPS